MTQRELADAVDVGVPHISKVEAGRENPSPKLLGQLAEVFKVEREELLIVARRLPENLVDDLAENPAEALAFLRTWPGSKAKKR
jgi:transcriptional regulator with XRE-family HTH domain